jgi:2,5-diketo-D-gluconate reductase A
MSNLMQNPVIAALAGKHGVDPGQVVLRWHVQIGAVPVPKSVTPSRFRSNLEIFDFELDDDDLDRISGLDTGHRIAGDQYHPATWEEF